MINIECHIVQTEKGDYVITPRGIVDKLMLKSFVNAHPSNNTTVFSLVVERITGNKTYGQLSKAHAMIRELSRHSGTSFKDMKLLVKKESGLITGEIIKSFRDCSYEELETVIHTCLDIGEKVNCPLQ